MAVLYINTRSKKLLNIYFMMLHKVCTILGLLFRKKECYDEASSENTVLRDKEMSLILKNLRRKK